MNQSLYLDHLASYYSRYSSEIRRLSPALNSSVSLVDLSEQVEISIIDIFSNTISSINIHALSRDFFIMSTQARKNGPAWVLSSGCLYRFT